MAKLICLLPHIFRQLEQEDIQAVLLYSCRRGWGRTGFYGSRRKL